MNDKILPPAPTYQLTPAPASQMLIRTMVAEDIERVHLIDKLSFSMPWPISSYRYELYENPASILHVAEVQPEGRLAVLVGMIVTWLIIDEAHIATIAVHPSFRSQGIGKKLLFTSLQTAVQHGARLATLEVRQGNQPAINMYTRFGFKVEGRRTRYYQDTNEDAIIMTVTGLDEAYVNKLAELITDQPSPYGGLA